MTEPQEGVIQKGVDLKVYYDMAQEAFQQKNVDKALHISKDGLEQAKLQNNTNWIDKFSSFNTNVSHLQELTPSIKKETLTIVNGIGPKVAQRLSSNGIHSILELAKSTPTRLVKIEGIGLSTAQKYIEGAKNHLRTKKLNDFSRVIHNENEIEPLQEPSSLSPALSKKSQKLFDDKFKKLRSGKWYPPKHDVISDEEIEYEEIQEEIDEAEDHTELDIQEPILKSVETNEISPNLQQDNEAKIPPPVQYSKFEMLEHVNASKEVLPRSQINQLLQKIRKELELSEFALIERIPELRTIFTGIDFIAIKPVRVMEFLDLLYIIPIKLSALKGSYIVSDNAIEYNSTENTEIRNYQFTKVLQSYLGALIHAESTISQNLSRKGSLFHYFTNYLKLDISIEKTLTGKNLCFHSGPLQYQIVIEPVLLCQNTVGFTEKLVPFAFQKSSNTHIVELSQFSNLLQYLDQKYFLIETYSERKSALTLQCDASNTFMEDVRKASLPFMVYGFVFLFTLLFQEYSFLSLLINLGYGVIAFYIIIIGYIYIRLYKQKSELVQEFSTPYYQRDLGLDDTNLILIREELSPQLMDQFVYECVGKHQDSNILNKIEQDNANNFLSKLQSKKEVEHSFLFEPEILPTTEYPFNHNTLSKTNESSDLKESKKSDSHPKSTIIDKYSSFLED
ncbi:MAG: helix-hairpin-helix domain-containing protein [Promethearchaeota archaeon]